MNCKPGQRALIVRESPTDPCVGLRTGCPVTVDRLHVPRTVLGAMLEAISGPAWVVRDPPSCPSGVSGCCDLEVIPDQCLRPFDDAADLVVAAEGEVVGAAAQAGVESP
jgi:hypothetical protein